MCDQTPTQITPFKSFWTGARTAVPIMIGYWPVAMTFGATCVAAGFEPWQAGAVSIFVYAGAAQFILLAAVKAGTPWLTVVAFCGLVNARHLLYGPLIVELLPKSLRARLALSAGLTDEVFATSLAHLGTLEANDKKPARSGAWFGGLALASYLSWVFGTILGAAIGSILEQASPHINGAMLFAFPALFLVLVLHCLSPVMLWPILAAGATAGALACAGQSALAIIAGAIVGVICYRRPKIEEDNSSE